VLRGHSFDDILGRSKAWLSHPFTRGLDLDDPRTTEQRRAIIQHKPFLRRVYAEWYTTITRALPRGDEPVLEIGSGAGFLADFIPGLITSEILVCRGVRVVLDAGRLPFGDGALRSIVMTNVLHHLVSPRQFFAEAARCVRSDGVVVMIEPWNSTWSRFIYTALHHEPFLPDVREWERTDTGPLSGANGALPWILFARDLSQFERAFPEWDVKAVRLGMPFCYLLSGGISFRSLMPAVTFPLWRRVEMLLQPWMASWAMFAEIRLTRRSSSLLSSLD
jgi:SAM-dependent methyltransferase